MRTPKTLIVQAPSALMTGGTSCYFDLDESRLASWWPEASGPLDAPDQLPCGGAWNYEVAGQPLSYASVLRPGVLA